MLRFAPQSSLSIGKGIVFKHTSVEIQHSKADYSNCYGKLLSNIFGKLINQIWDKSNIMLNLSFSVFATQAMLSAELLVWFQ